MRGITFYQCHINYLSHIAMQIKTSDLVAHITEHKLVCKMLQNER